MSWGSPRSTSNGNVGGSDPTGLVLAIGGGYDCWVGAEWSIGVMGRIAYAPLKLNDVGFNTIAPAVLRPLRCTEPESSTHSRDVWRVVRGVRRNPNGDGIATEIRAMPLPSLSRAAIRVCESAQAWAFTVCGCVRARQLRAPSRSRSPGIAGPTTRSVLWSRKNRRCQSH